MLGQTLGTYRITGKLSEGGMGVVYRGEHTLLERGVAVKVILPALSQNREVVRRFFAEAKVTSSIRHPGIVEIFDFGYAADGCAYLVMELLAGESMARRLARVRRMDEVTAALLGRGIAGALAAAHARGVVHRDLKPDNIFLVPDADAPCGERPKVLDFGIAKLGERTADSTTTQAGALLGTPTYMSPEQCRGTGTIDARADLYALGCILYEALAGRPPFLASTAEVIGAHLFLEPPALADHATVSPAFAALVMRLLAKDPDRRPASSLEVVAALTSVLAELAPPGLAAMTPTPAPLGPTPPTTLSGAACERPAPAIAPRRRGRFVAPLLAAGVIAAALGLVVRSRSVSPSDERATPAAAITAPADAPLAVTAPPPDAGPGDAAVDAADIARTVEVDAGTPSIPRPANRTGSRRPKPPDRPPPDAGPVLVDEVAPLRGPLVDELPPQRSP